jgi:hypothetical protein
MTDDDEGLGPYPEWKQAADKFMDGGKGPGDLLEFEWLHEAFGMAAPDTASSVAEYQKAQLRFLNLFKHFERWLLEEQLLALQSRPGLGYEIVRPAEQARWAAEQLAARMGREFRRAGRRLAFTKVEELTDQQRQAHVDTMARVGRMRAAMRQPRVIPKPGAA